MKALITAILCGLMLTGCSMHNMIDKIPDAGFDSFMYRRTGNVSSSSIKAVNAIKVGDMIEVEQVEVVETFPFVDFYLEIKGFKK